MVESFVSMMKDNGYIEVSTDMYRIAYYYNDCTYELFTHIDLLEDTVKDLCGRGCAINCIERI